MNLYTKLSHVIDYPHFHPPLNCHYFVLVSISPQLLIYTSSTQLIVHLCVIESYINYFGLIGLH